MRQYTKFAVAFAAVLAASPAFAQGSNAGTTTPATHNEGTHGSATNTSSANAPSDRNPVLTDSGEVRTSKLVGSSVYNDHDEKVGSVDDIVVGKDHGLKAVLSVGGFLGMGNRYVEVPYSQLKLGDTKASSDNRVVLPGASKASLEKMAQYHYTANN